MNRTERALKTYHALRQAIPEPETELVYRDPFELLVSVILSAQCTDARVNKVTPALFKAFPTAEAMSAATPEEIFPFIQSVSYPNNKSKHLAGMAQMVMETFGGAIPETIESLVKLPGVGHKTASVVASVAFGVDAMPVDTHVFRVANRIGLVKNADTVQKVERQLKRVLPKSTWSEAHHLLILHGRYRCVARQPKCSECPLQSFCKYYAELERLPAPITGLSRRRGAYYCKTRGKYFDEPDLVSDRYGTQQIACPSCGSMNVFDAKTGHTTKKVRDYRV